MVRTWEKSTLDAILAMYFMKEYIPLNLQSVLSYLSLLLLLSFLLDQVSSKRRR